MDIETIGKGTSFFNVTTLLVHKHRDDNVWWAASQIKSAVPIVQEIFEMWQSGRSFAYPNTMSSAPLFGQEPPKRVSDSAEEIEGCADLLYGLLQATIMEYWAASLSRDEAVTMGRIMEKQMLPDFPAQYKIYGNAYSIVAGVTIKDSRSIADRWNDAHPDEKPIQYSEFMPTEKGA